MERYKEIEATSETHATHAAFMFGLRHCHIYFMRAMPNIKLLETRRLHKLFHNNL